MQDLATLACGLVPSLQIPTKQSPLRRSVLTGQPFAVDLLLDIDYQLCKVYGPQGMDVKNCKSGSENSCTDVHDEQHSGLPSVLAETIAKVEQEMHDDQHMTVCKLCEWILEVSKSTINKILTEHLHYCKKCARWVLKMLTEDRKQQCVIAAHGFLERCAEQSEELLDSIVTVDETWIHYMTPETKEKSCQWQNSNFPKLQKFK